MQTTSNILMVSPVAFDYNSQTAANNFFQTESDENKSTIQEKALHEFKEMVKSLKEKGINVIVLEDTVSPPTPDSIFPNNWISFHENHQVAIYPMFASNRRLERRTDEVLDLLESKGFETHEIIDYSSAEDDEIYLEGTGSMILDRENKIAYAAISPRTDEDLFEEFCEDFEYIPILFHAYQTVEGEKKLIYHTNVMMCVADKYVVICLDSLTDKTEKKQLVSQIKASHKEIIAITEAQMNQFAGNMLQLKALSGNILVMSETAKNSLTKDQINAIEQFNPILSVNIETIEKLGGGSARCMMAEIFLPKHSQE